MSQTTALDRIYYKKLGRAPKGATKAIVAAATYTNVVTGVAGEFIHVDRIIIAETGGNALSVHMEYGGTQIGPLIRVPANTTVEVQVMVNFPVGEGLDIESAGTTPTAHFYVDYHMMPRE